ncbi:MAG: hypothetical protein ACM3PY_04575 [Omnitrophica WOR_2 bacterium]
MKDAGLTNAIFFGGDGIFGQYFLDRTDEDGFGAFSAMIIPPASPQRTKFDQAYLAAYGIPPGRLSPYTWTAYDAVAVLIYNIKRVAIKGDDGNLYIPRDTLVRAVRNTSDYQGLSGILSCAPDGECAQSGPTFYINQDGVWVEAPDD